MIFLTPAVDPDVTAHQTMLEEIRSQDLTRREADKLVERMREMLEELGPKDNANFTTAYAVDQDGNVFRDVKVYYTSVFTYKEDRWVADGALAVNYSEALRLLEEILPEVVSD